MFAIEKRILAWLQLVEKENRDTLYNQIIYYLYKPYRENGYQNITDIITKKEPPI